MIGLGPVKTIFSQPAHLLVKTDIYWFYQSVGGLSWRAKI